MKIMDSRVSPLHCHCIGPKIDVLDDKFVEGVMMSRKYNTFY